VLLVLAAGAGVARADEPADCERRLHWIDARLARTAHRARVWSWGWGIGLGAATAANLAVVPLVDADVRVDYYVGAATSFIGVVPLLLLPLEVMDDADTLHARIAGGGACAALLPEAEQLLARDAANQADGRAWWVHAANVVLNGGAGLLLGFGYDHWTSGVLTAVVGTGIGEAMIFTQPVDSLGDLEHYRVTPLLAPGQVGLLLGGRF
jgi:hypothetical protein